MSIEVQSNPYAIPSAPGFKSVTAPERILCYVRPITAYAYVLRVHRITSTLDPPPISEAVQEPT